MFAPYEGEPDNVGILTLEPDTLTEIAQRAAAFGMHIAYTARSAKAALPWSFEPTPVALAWQDSFGTFSQELAVSRRTPLTVAAPPAGGAVLGLTNLGERRLSVCGVAAG